MLILEHRFSGRPLPVPLHRAAHALLDQPRHQIWAHDVLPEALLLQQLEVAQRRARVCQVLEVRRAAPVPQVGEVGDKRRLGQELLRREVVEVERVRERLDKLRRARVCMLAKRNKRTKGKDRKGRGGGSVCAYLELDFESRVAAPARLVVLGRRGRRRHVHVAEVSRHVFGSRKM